MVQAAACLLECLLTLGNFHIIDLVIPSALLLLLGRFVMAAWCFISSASWQHGIWQALSAHAGQKYHKLLRTVFVELKDINTWRTRFNTWRDEI